MPLPSTTGTAGVSRQQALQMGCLEVTFTNATASAGAATANGGAGVITTESLTTAAGAQYTLTLTNSLMNFGSNTNDMMSAEVFNGSNTLGTPAIATITPGTGQAVVVVQNIHTSVAFAGTLKIGYQVIREAK